MPNPDSQRQPQSKGLISDQRRRPEHGGEELGDPSDDGCRYPESRTSSEQDSHGKNDGLHSAGSGDAELADSKSNGGCQPKGWHWGRVPTGASQEMADSLGHGRQEQRGDGSGGDFLSPFGACGGGSTVSRMGGAAHGLSCGMDFPGLLWPAGKGPYQHDWEAARTVKGKQPGRPARIKALGNAVVPSQALPVFIAIRQRIEETKASTNRFGMLEIED